MKKLLIILSMLLLLSTIVFAQEVPTISSVSNVSGQQTEASGFQVSSDGQIFAINNGISSYNLTTDTFTQIYSDDVLNSNLIFTYNPNDNMLYYIGRNNFNERRAFKINLDGSGKINLTTDYTWLGNPTTNKYVALNPTTEKIYLIGGGLPQYFGLHEYNIITDTWTKLNSFNNSGDYLYSSKCLVRESENNLYCFGGTDDSGDYYSEIVYKFDIDTNISSTFTLPLGWYDGLLHYYEPYVYIMAGETSRGGGLPQNNTMWFNLNTDTSGELINPFGVPYEGYQTCFQYDDLNSYCLGAYVTDAWAEDLSLNKLTWSCVEDWSPSYSACSISDNQTLSYTDNNACGTFIDLPLDDGTVSNCNYCTIDYTETVDNCATTYDYNNYGACCGLTGFPDDCTLPNNVTDCVGVHSTEDIPNVVIDFGVEFGREFIALAGLIVVIGLFFAGKRLMKK